MSWKLLAAFYRDELRQIDLLVENVSSHGFGHPLKQSDRACNVICILQLSWVTQRTHKITRGSKIRDIVVDHWVPLAFNPSHSVLASCEPTTSTWSERPIEGQGRANSKGKDEGVLCMIEECASFGESDKRGSHGIYPLRSVYLLVQH